jgi:hypothetical protein
MAKSDMKDAVSEALGGKKEKAPKKEVKSLHITKSANGGHIIRHEHTHPEHHPDETHTTKGDDQLAQHVMANMGQPNPGEAAPDPTADPTAAAAAMAGGGAPAAGGAAPMPGASAGGPPMGA